MQRARHSREMRFEALESRQYLAADFLVTEFMASNGGSLLDEDSEPSDWIEIQNVGNTAGSLSGWALEDSADRWTFPNVSVAAGGRLVVFASNKDRTAGPNLHTNFALAAEGEYLALLRPDQSVRQQFNPYPSQVEDVSYGILEDSSSVVGSGAPAKFKIPTVADGSGTSWTGTGFNDSAWTTHLFSGTRSVVISEISTGATDWFEIQNVSVAPVNTTGWFVAINDGNVPQTINQVDPITWTIGPSMAAGQTSYRTENSADTSNYFGSLIDWPTTGSRGWVMIVDNTGKIADFVVWGYSAAELSTINVSVGGYTFNSQAIAAVWNSAPVSYAGTSSNSLHRQGSSDDDNATNWVYTGTPSLGTINPGLVTPMTGPGQPVLTGIGFNTNPQGLNVKYIKANTPVFDVNVAEQVVITPSMQTSVTNQLVSYVNYNTNGGPGNFGAEVPFPTQSVGQDVDDFVLEVTGTVVLPNAGQWTFGVNSDDGFRLVLTNGVNTFMSEFIGGRPAGDTLATFNIPDGGAYQVRLVYFERGGGASMEFFAAPGAHGTFNANFDLIGDVANGGLSTTGFGGAIQTNVLAQLRNVNSSLWTRIPFTVGNPSAFSSLALRMKYNDGFIAYLNGTEIARRNAVSTNWNATATSPRTDAASSVFEEINVTQYLHLLQAGTNILSVHGQNISAGDNTFLVLPELVGTRTEPEFRYFLDPTPGSANQGGVVGFVGDTGFSHTRGFYNSPFSLTITTPTPGAVIRYTVDGSDPSETTGFVYDGPININGTTILRAAAFKAGFQPSNIDTQTYFFLSDILTQSELPPAGWPANQQINGHHINYGMDPNIVNNPTWGPQMMAAMTALPAISLVTPLGNLFNPSSGIYVNPSGDGDSWEKPASVELINPNGTPGFQIDAGLRIRGGFSRSSSNPKHAFRLLFQDEYDGELNFPLFGSEGVDEFERVDLRTAQNYSWSFQNDGSNVMVEEVWNRDTSRDMGQGYTRSRWYHLYLNGQYWGLYQTEERAEASYASSYNGGEEEDYDVIKHGPGSIYATDGTMAAWTQLYNLANTLRTAVSDTARHAIYMQIQGKNPDGTRNTNFPVLLDVDNLIEYMQVIFYSGDRDAPISNFANNQSPNNWYGFRNRNSDDGFRFVLHDGEHTLFHGMASRLGPWPAGDPNGNGIGRSSPQWIHQMLAFAPEYRVRFGDLTQQNFFGDGVFTPAKALARFNARTAEIDTAIIAESARWGDSKSEPGYTKTNWLNASNNTRNFFSSRHTTVVQQLRTNTLFNTVGTFPLYPTVDAPVFNRNSGQVTPGASFSMVGAGTMYYTTDGSDPRLVGGAVSGTAQTYMGGFPINSSVTINARSLSGGIWSAMTTATFFTTQTASATNTAIVEINYNPDEPTAAETAAPGWNAAWTAQEFEFIELRNFGNQPIDLSGVKFDIGIDFQFPSPGGPILSPGQNIVLVKNQTAFEIRYGTGINIGGTFTGSLNNGGEQLRLRTGSDVLIRDFTYDNSGAWPGRADGKGSTLEIISPTADGNLATSWRNSVEYNGTPGATGIGDINSIVVNEVLTHTDPPQVDAVEFHNPTGAAIDISGWYLSDDADNYQKYLIPNGTVIPAGGYLVLDESDFNPTPGMGTSFSFNSATGDDVYLVSATPAGKLANFIDHVDFPAAANGESFGRWPNATGKLYPMVSTTFGAANSGPRIGPVVISEIMYNHPSANDDLEYVELLNITDNPINLTNWKFDRGIDMTFGNVTIQPRSTLVVVRFDPNDPLNAAKVNTFRTTYGISAAVPLAGGYAGLLNGGVLDNGGETIRLARPDAPEPDMTIPYLLVDEVEYDDVAPWPTTPDGTGPSLTRINTQTVYGHEPTNWSGASATPGALPLPAAATNLTANATAANRVHLAWLDPAVNETGFKIERSTDGANFIVVATLGVDATSYDDVNLQSSLGYFYRVRSFNDAGNAAASNTAQVTTPQLVTITGAAGHDTYHVQRVGTQIHVYENTAPVGQPTYSSELAALGASLTINALAGDDTLTVTANGQPTLGVNQLLFNSGSGTNSLQLTNGAALIDSTVDAGSALSTTVSGGAHLTTARLNQNGLSISGAGTRVTIQPDGALANVLSSLSMDATSILDLTNNDLVLRGTAGTKDAIHADAQAKIVSAQNGLDANLVTNWDGPGIASTSARASNVATGFDLVGLGVIRNSDLDVTTGIPGSSYTSFGGVPVTADDVLLKYTYIGDANLNGLVSFDDYVGMDNAFFELIPNIGWATGDVTFDNAINFDDYSKVDQAFFFQGAPLASSSIEEAPGFAGGSDAEIEKAPGSAGGSSGGIAEESVGLRPTLQVVDIPAQIASSEAESHSTAGPNHQAADSLADARLSVTRRSDSRDLWDDALLGFLE